MIVLGVDGMDHLLVRRYLEEGRLPNVRRLMDAGGLEPLRTTMPPQSPVAWSSFITGANPGHHGIFDFNHRDPATVGPVGGLIPFISMSRVSEGGTSLKVRSWVLPITSGEATLLRRGTAFWEPLSAAGVATTILRVPANFPPVESSARCLSGMGTPDLLGTYGTYFLFSNAEVEELAGGRFVPVAPKDGKIETAIPGPPHPLRRKYGKIMKRPRLEARFTVWIDPESRAAKFDVGGHVFILREREWSDWVPVEFELIPHARSVRGISRFYLKDVEPIFRLYVSPVNIDPADPALPISDPEGYAQQIAEESGRFHTQSMPEDTNALGSGVLSDEEFLEQALFVLEEQTRQYRRSIEEFDGGFLFFYFSSIDQVSHVFWRAVDPDHPLHTPALAKAHGDVIPDLYAAIDRLIGEALDRIDPSTVLIVMSDHGFTSFRREFHLNSWLRKEGYAHLSRGLISSTQPLFAEVDWSRTVAYGLGLNGLYLNRAGREAGGIVEPEEADGLLEEIEEKLLALRDPKTGERVVSRVFRSEKIYRGDVQEAAPDLLVGYNDGYRASWKTILGDFREEILTDNREKWSGDHCIDPAFVPGVLIANRKIVEDDPALIDLAPTILSHFGLPPTDGMEGRRLFAEKP